MQQINVWSNANLPAGLVASIDMNAVKGRFLPGCELPCDGGVEVGRGLQRKVSLRKVRYSWFLQEANLSCLDVVR